MIQQRKFQGGEGGAIKAESSSTQIYSVITSVGLSRLGIASSLFGGRRGGGGIRMNIELGLNNNSSVLLME